MRTVLAFLAAWLLAGAAGPNYEASVNEWRQQREARLKEPTNWLSLTGLFWLQEGANTMGSAPGSRVQLPAGFPAKAGTFVRQGNTVRYQPAGGEAKTLRTDKDGKPDVIQSGRLSMNLIERGTKIGVRLRDPESPTRQNFRGLDWYPVKPEWNVRARFVPQPRKMTFDVQAGDKQEMNSPGYVEWTHKGQRLRLTPVQEGDQLFFIFRDKTAGKTTYPAARFIYTDLPADGFVQVDFNKAYNPPCVFTPYATCPLPPPENRLPIPVEAGEKMYRASP